MVVMFMTLELFKDIVMNFQSQCSSCTIMGGWGGWGVELSLSLFLKLVSHFQAHPCGIPSQIKSHHAIHLPASKHNFINGSEADCYK